MRFLLAVLLATFASSASAQELLTNPSFEVDEEVCGFPSDFGDWGVDGMTIVPTEAGVTPRTGGRMLRLEFPFFVESAAGCVGAGGGVGTDAAQLADVSSCHPAGTHARLRMTAHFNAATGAGVSAFSCFVRAFSGPTTEFGMSATTPLSEASTEVVPDGDPAAWQRCEVELDLPPGATYVAAFVSSLIAAGSREVYVDDVSLVPVAGRCGFDCTAPGAICPDGSAAPDATLCDPDTGACVACLADVDCDDGMECTEEACLEGFCELGVSPMGTPCSSGVCDGATKGATCVECLLDEDCDAPETCDTASRTCVGHDAGTVDDAGTVEDAGMVEDAGTTSDAGSPDAGRDAGAAPDAGGIDAGTTPVTTGGCGCSVRGGRSLTGLAALWLLGMLAARRRR